MFRLLYSFVAIAFLLMVVPPQLNAQTSATLPIQTISPVEDTGILSCFDYYKFGSVQAVMSPSVSGTVAGSAITFSGQLSNSNDYPLVDGTLYAKVFREDENTFAAGDGNPVVDQFVVKDDITLAASSHVDVSHDWTVPNSAKEGKYYIAYFFVTSDRYNLMGLSFTDDVVGNTASFSVATEEGAVAPAELGKVGTTINGRDHHFAAVPLTFSKSEKVIVTTSVSNPSNETKILPLQWNQYSWDAMSPENRRNTKTEIITLAPQETKTVSYEVKGQRESVVYLVAIAQDKDAKSILNVRYIQDGIEETRINFPSINKFPLNSGEETTLFACAHSTNLPVVDGNTLTLELLDKDGALIHSYQYEGKITGDMAGFGEVFTPDKDYNYLTLNAKLERDGVSVEEVSIIYDCNVIDSSKCDENMMELPASTSWQQIVLILVGLGSLIVVFVVIIVFFRRKGVSTQTSVTDTTTTMMSIFMMLLFGAAIIIPHGTEAKTVSWNYVDNAGTYYAHWGWYGYENYNITAADGGNGWMDALRNPNYTITYGANVHNDSAGGALVTDGSSVTIGTQLRFEPESFDSSDISWFGTGYSNDSPNGDWVAGAGPSHNSPAQINSFTNSIACRAQDYVGSVPANTGGNWDVYIPMSVNPPSITVSHGGTAGLSCDASQTNCTVTSAGTINSTFTFAQTNAKLYYRYANTVAYNMINPRADINTCDSSTVRAIADPDINGVEPCEFRVRANACFGDNTPLSKNQSADFSLTVPQQTVGFTLTVPGAANNPPAAPTITGAVTSDVNTSNIFTFNSADPDGNQLRYGIDWDSSGSVDQWVPGSGYVNSGTNQSTSYSWATVGAKTFRVLAEDSNSGNSGWTTHSVTVSATPSCSTVGYVATSIAEFNSYSTDCVNAGYSALEIENNVEYGDLGLISNTNKCLVTRDVGSGWTARLYANPSCTGTVATAFISGTDCTIAVGASSCNATLTWSIANAASPNVYNLTTSGSVSSNANGSGMSVTLTNGSNSFAARDSSSQLSNTFLTASCASGSSWDGSSCAAVVATATVSGSGCAITTGASTCNGLVTWTSTNATLPTLRNVTTDTLISSNANGTNVPIGLTHGYNYVIVRDGSSILASADILAMCTGSDTWNGTSCVATGACSPDGHTQSFLAPTCCSGTYSTSNTSSCTVYNNSQMPYGGSICLNFPEYTCTPSVVPSTNLTINGSDGPVSVNNGDVLSIVWNSSNVASCTAFGAGWGSGNAVAISGAAAINASVSDTYIINCNGVIDSVVVNVNAGSAPSAPTIIGPITSSVGAGNVFILNSIDSDGDNIYYEVDWNNDGTTDAYTPGVGYVVSGTDRTATQSWGAGGSYTFRARATDDVGLSSGWTTHTVTIASSPIVNIEVQVNGGGWSGGDQTVNPGDSITIRWTSTDSTTCIGTNVNTGGATNSAGVSVTSPAPNSSLSYQIECTGPGGTITEDIVVTARQLPNLTQPSVTFTPSATVNPVTGNYDSLEVRFQTGNNGGSDTNATITYLVEIDYGNNGSYDVSDTGTITNLVPGGNYNGSEIFTNVPFGNNTIRVTIDSNDDVNEVDETDNSRTLGATIAPAAPNFTLTVNPNIVREGQTATIAWDTEVSYPLNCTVSGPALTTHSFNPNVNGTTGNRTTGLLSSKSEYLLSCTEPITNTTFTESASVEIIPNAEEI